MKDFYFNSTINCKWFLFVLEASQGIKTTLRPAVAITSWGAGLGISGLLFGSLNPACTWDWAL